MLLAIDIGNTNIVMGLIEEGKIRASWRITTDLHKTEDEYAVLILDLIRSLGIEGRQIHGVICSNVVPQLTSVFSELSKKNFGTHPLLVSHEMRTGLKLLYNNPHEIGADRIVNAVGGYHFYGGPLIIVDFGTATTFCAISAEAEYLGGAIAPGILISVEALFKKAAKLPKIELIKPKTVIGKDTVSSMQSGTLIGFACMVDGLIERMKQEMAANPYVVATGGLAQILAPASRFIQEVRPDLTLQGLRILYELNQPPSRLGFST